MISFVTGKPRNGKGLVAMQQVIDELVHGSRCIITNLPIRVDPWVRRMKRAGKFVFKPEKGLRAYLQENHGGTFDVEKRVFVLPDEDIPEFFLYRVRDGALVKAEKTFEGTKWTGFDASLGIELGGVLYIVDEAWKFYGARNWQQTGAAVQFYASQHGKFGDDWLIVTQHTKQVDTAFRQIAQDFWVCVHHAKRRIGFWRQPNIFSVSVYTDPPMGKDDSPMSRRVFRLDPAGLGGTYDTMAGVGLGSGGGGADIGTKYKGLPTWTLILVVVAIGLGVIMTARGAGWVFGRLIGGATKPATRAVSEIKTSVRSGEVARTNVLVRPPAALAETNRVHLVGFAGVSGRSCYFLSDGRRLSPGDLGVMASGTGWIVVDGQRITFK